MCFAPKRSTVPCARFGSLGQRPCDPRRLAALRRCRRLLPVSGRLLPSPTSRVGTAAMHRSIEASLISDGKPSRPQSACDHEGFSIALGAHASAQADNRHDRNQGIAQAVFLKWNQPWPKHAVWSGTILEQGRLGLVDLIRSTIGCSLAFIEQVAAEISIFPIRHMIVCWNKITTSS